MLDFKPQSRRTDIGKAIDFLSGVMKRRCTAFLLSDFYDRTDFSHRLTVCNRKHDLVAIQVYDRRASELPDVGLMKIVDAETGFEQYVDTGSRKLRDSYHKYWLMRQTQLRETFNKSNVDNVSVATDGDFVSQLMSLFRQRG